MSAVSGEKLVVRYETWTQYPVHWTAIWIGTLTALATALVLGLIGIAVGAHIVVPGYRLLKWSEFGFGALIFSVFGAFFSFALGGWVAGKIAGIRHSEPAALQGAFVWLLTVLMLILLAGLGAGSLFGTWYGGLTGAPGWIAPPPGPIDPNAVIAARNAALGAMTAILLGLVGSVLGGWLASGEPMSWTYDRRKTATTQSRATATRAVVR